jgi:hypothetical protein
MPSARRSSETNLLSTDLREPVMSMGTVTGASKRRLASPKCLFKARLPPRFRQDGRRSGNYLLMAEKSSVWHCMLTMALIAMRIGYTPLGAGREVSEWNMAAVGKRPSAKLTVRRYRSKRAGAFEFLRYSSPSGWALRLFRKVAAPRLKSIRSHLLASNSQLGALYLLPRAVTIQS